MANEGQTTKQNLIQGTPTPLTVQFTASSVAQTEFGSFNERVGFVPFKVCFNDLTTGPTQDVRTWKWDFGEPNVYNPTDDTLQEHSAIQNPVHTYITPGKYTVRLTVNSNVPGVVQATHQKPEYITVLPKAGACFNTQTISDMHIHAIWYTSPSTIVLGGYLDSSGSSYICFKKTTNYGETWTSTIQPTGSPLGMIDSICQAENGDLVAAGIRYDGLGGTFHCYTRSYDTGSSWIAVADMGVQPTMPTHTYVLYKTEAGGLIMGCSGQYYCNFSYAPCSRIFRSPNNGATWVCAATFEQCYPSSGITVYDALELQAGFWAATPRQYMVADCVWGTGFGPLAYSDNYGVSWSTLLPDVYYPGFSNFHSMCFIAASSFWFGYWRTFNNAVTIPDAGSNVTGMTYIKAMRRWDDLIYALDTYGNLNVARYLPGTYQHWNSALITGEALNSEVDSPNGFIKGKYGDFICAWNHTFQIVYTIYSSSWESMWSGYG
jgi:hypothetical protein